MDISVLDQYFEQYGTIAIFVIIFLEYLNLPGLAAGIVMPLCGVIAANADIPFAVVLFITVCSGFLASCVLYLLGRLGGLVFLDKYLHKFPKQKEKFLKTLEWLRAKGVYGVFLAMLLPMIRTLISIPAGLLKMKFGRYALSILLGITLWNLLFVGAGYFLGETIFEFF